MELMFRRKEWVTKCSDPTVVVRYEDRAYGLAIEEFQGVYRLFGDMDFWADTKSLGELVQGLGEALHKALEEVHDLEERQNEMSRASVKEQYEFDTYVVKAVAAVLKAKGYAATYEYPGYVRVDRQVTGEEPTYWALGINQDGEPESVWTGQLHEASTTNVLTTLRCVVSSDDPLEMADALGLEMFRAVEKLAREKEEE